MTDPLTPELRLWIWGGCALALYLLLTAATEGKLSRRGHLIAQAVWLLLSLGLWLAESL